jgi:hypothetical protein
MLLEKVMPVYPWPAEEDPHETSVVQLAVVVGKDGTVIDVNSGRRRYASQHTAMKTDASGEILVGSAEAI